MELIKLELTPPTALLTLNRPNVRNAISPGLISEVRKALDVVEARSNLKALIITGEGKAFSAGADIANLQAMTAQSAEEARQDSLHFMNFFRDIYNFPKPIIAAVNGPAVGGGCGLASVCDMVVAAEDAKFGYTEVKVGFIPALVSVFLVRICGEKKMRELLLTGRLFSAREAMEIGLVNRVVERSQLLDAARDLADLIARNSPTAVRLSKQLFKDIQGLNLDEALAQAVHVNALIRTTADFKEGVTAFLEKREPEWKGH